VVNEFTYKGLTVVLCSIRRHDGYIPEARILELSSGKELARFQDYQAGCHTREQADEAAKNMAIAWIDRYVGALRS
jgi:hypothetical protein